ncbi:MAG: hypothetical protein K0S33_3643 [Bacteroidetes bacterium]|jgi:4-amino-4-deoxy-L-arabinose transferase-like glycosyltransferase|nr:hypothetical protein [Bacteroidota bacterium]
MLKKLLKHPHTPFWFIAISLAIGLTLPVLIQDGMFMDAMLYTSVSHNLSQGIGTFWFPQFSLHNVAGLASFHEQPPLVFGIQAGFFSIFGDSMYVERFYTFLTMCVAGLLIHVFWRTVYKNEPLLKKTGWLPILLWITIPVCFWSYSNNMHENTMSIFTLGSVLFIYKALQGKWAALNWILAGIFIFAATLSKGIPGFFPITVPFLYWLTIRKQSFLKTIGQSFLIALIPALLYGLLLLLIPDARKSLSMYLFERALHRINEVPTVDSRFYILGRIFMELLPQMGLVVIVLLIARFKKTNTNLSAESRKALFFVLIGLSASAPLMLTMVQKGFYFVPALPFFAMGLAVLIAPLVSGFTEHMQTNRAGYRIFLSLSILLFIATISFSFLQKGKASRNEDMLHDVYLIGSVVPKQSTVTTPGNIWNHWDFRCYLVRYFNISVDVEKQYEYYLAEKSQSTLVPAEYKKVELSTLGYDVYKRE